jgi:glutamate synthase domain-containing protein 3
LIFGELKIMHEKKMHKDLKRVAPSGLEDVKDGIAKVNALNMHYQNLNSLLQSLGTNPVREIHAYNVNGQRYIGTGLKGDVRLNIHGTPGNDLAAFMDGSTICVHGNAQDGVGNTMNNGKVVIHGHAGDIVGYSMRGGKIFIRDDVGYRVGIHMKEHGTQKPILVVGGTAQDFLGEYMAGGILVVLGLTLKNGEKHKAKFVGTGMHSGIIYLRGEVVHTGKEVNIMESEESDMILLRPIIKEFCDYFKFDVNTLLAGKFSKLIPSSTRPYGRLYTY